MDANKMVGVKHKYILYKTRSFQVAYPTYSQTPNCNLSVQMTMSHKKVGTTGPPSVTSAKWLGDNSILKFFKIKTQDREKAGIHKFVFTATTKHIQVAPAPILINTDFLIRLEIYDPCPSAKLQLTKGLIKDMKVGLGSSDPKGTVRNFKDLEDSICGPDTADEPPRLSNFCCGPRFY